MIHYFICRGYGFTVRPLQRDARAPKIVTLPYDKALDETELPRATYIFTDIERLSSSDRVAAGRLYRKLETSGCRVLNDPRRVKTRLPLLRRLHDEGVNAFNVYTLDEIDAPMHFPVFVRVSDDHGGPLTDLIFDHETLKRAIEALVELGYPPATLIVTEYAAEPLGPGIFRKLSVFRVGEHFLPHPCVHDTSWTIKWGRTGVATSELYDEELEIIKTNPFADQMRRVFEIGGIDFGRVDFSLVDGRPCIYEINTNPTLAGPAAHPVPQRVESRRLWWDGFLSAMHEIDHFGEESTPIDTGVENPTVLSRALQTYPDLKQGFLNLAEAFSQSGNREAALENAERAVAGAPDDADTAIRASRVVADNAQLANAVDIVERAVRSNPKHFELLLQTSWLLARARRRVAAIDAAERAISLQPKTVRGYEALFRIHWILGNRTAAVGAAIKAVSRVRNAHGTAASMRYLKRNLASGRVRQLRSD